VTTILDTNALLWLLADDSRLSQHARQHLESSPQIAISEVSLWEISIKVSIGKLKPIPELLDTVKDLGFLRLNISDPALRAYESLPLIHRDPFDRMLVAQSLAHKATLLTSDGHLADYGVHILDARA
jgi:PIN domain nuclease of toxin-antitoxin system